MTNKYANLVDEKGKKSGVPRSLVAIGELALCLFQCTGFLRFQPIP
jgi:hypothetical protein